MLHHHHPGEKRTKAKIRDMVCSAMQCMQGNPYFENAPLLTSQVAVMVAGVQSTAYGIEGREGGRGFVKSWPCRNLLGPSCFDGKFYRRPPIKFYIISTAMVGHGTRAQWWTQDRQSVAAWAKVEPLDDQREPLCPPGVHLSLHFFTGTCTCT